MSTNGTESGVVLLRATFTVGPSGDVAVDLVGHAAITRREAAEMLAKLAAELAQKAAIEDEGEP